MRRRGEAFDVQHGKRRIGDGFAEHGLGVRSERRLQLPVRTVRGNERAFQPHAAHRVREQVVRAPVDGRRNHHVVARPGEVEHREEVRRLPRRREHARRGTLQLGYLGRHGVVRGVRKARVEIAGFLQVEKPSHVLARVELPRGGLVDGNLARLAVAGAVAALHARGAEGFPLRGCSAPFALPGRSALPALHHLLRACGLPVHSPPHVRGLPARLPRACSLPSIRCLFFVHSLLLAEWVRITRAL